MDNVDYLLAMQTIQRSFMRVQQAAGKNPGIAVAFARRWIEGEDMADARAAAAIVAASFERLADEVIGPGGLDELLDGPPGRDN